MTTGAAEGAALHSDEILTPDEVRALIGACSRQASSGLRNRALITILYRGGLRVCEALELELDELDPQGRTILSTHGNRTRRIGLDAGSFRVIERWVDRRAELEISPAAPLFCTLAGNPMSSSYLRGLLHRLAEKAKVDKRVSAEVLRRSLALELMEEGYSIVAIQSQLGHSAASVTSRYLARLGNGKPVDDLRQRGEWLP
jgi:site-specific recombinase XerD